MEYDFGVEYNVQQVYGDGDVKRRFIGRWLLRLLPLPAYGVQPNVSTAESFQKQKRETKEGYGTFHPPATTATLQLDCAVECPLGTKFRRHRDEDI